MIYVDFLRFLLPRKVRPLSGLRGCAHFGDFGHVSGISRSLLSIVQLNHLDGCAHVRSELVDGHAFGNSHRCIGMAE